MSVYKQTFIAFVVILTLFKFVICDQQLLMVLTLWRHGDRTPTKVFPKDIHNNADSWNQGLGQLTPRGMAMHYRLGEIIRKRYIESDDPKMNIINGTYNAREIYIRSTDVNRTLMSAYSNMAGFYPAGKYGVTIPNKGSVNWPEQWQPIPVHTVKHSTDNLLNTDAYCPKADELTDKYIKQSSEYLDVSNQNQLFELVKEKTGYEKVTLYDIGEVWDVLFIEKIYNQTHPWPSWVNTSIYARLTELKMTSDRLKFAYPQVARLRAGSVLGDMIGHMTARSECFGKGYPRCKEINKRKYWVYSAHDTTVMAFLQVLGNYVKVLGNHERPRYASSVILELWNNDNNFYVKVLYRDNPDTNAYRTITETVEGCPNTEFCPLQQFTARSKIYIPENWQKECGLTDGNEVDSSSDGLLLALTIIFAITTAVFLATTIFLVFKVCTMKENVV